LDANPGGPKLFNESVVHFPGLGDRRGSGKIGPSSFFAFTIKGELTYQKCLSLGGMAYGIGFLGQILEGVIEPSRRIIKNPKVFDFIDHPQDLGIAIVWANPDENHQAAPDFSRDLVIDPDFCPGNPLKQNAHGNRSG